jgi:hypothetical protein
MLCGTYVLEIQWHLDTPRRIAAVSPPQEVTNQPFPKQGKET